MSIRLGRGTMLGAVALSLLWGCSSDTKDPQASANDADAQQESQGGQGNVVAELRSEQKRVTPALSEGESAGKSEAAFAFRFLHTLSTDKNVTFSPHSLSAAFAMLSDAAESDTLQEIEDVLQFGTTNQAFHRAQDALQLALESRNREAIDDGFDQVDAQVLRLSNDIWLRNDAPPAPSFLDTLARYYGIGVHRADFGGRPDAAREAINAKVASDTNELIVDLLPSAALDQDTVAVLTNALYFKAPWEKAFSAPEAGDFHRLDGSTVSAQLLKSTRDLDYYAGDGFVSVAVPYYGRELSMLLVVPDDGKYVEVREQLSGDSLASIVEGLHAERVDLTLPTFKLTSSLPVVEKLKELGLTRAFDKNVAEFPKLQSEKFQRVHVDDVLHQATVTIDEKGTEASAATAINGSGGGGSGEPPEIKVVAADRPFLFVIRDNPSGALLFVGQVVSP